MLQGTNREMAVFDYPWQYKFPPFFTIQPNQETRKKQLEAWCSLILSYHRHMRNYSLDVTEAQSSPLFYNKSIDRKLSMDGIYTVLDELNKRAVGTSCLRRIRICFVLHALMFVLPAFIVVFILMTGDECSERVTSMAGHVTDKGTKQNSKGRLLMGHIEWKDKARKQCLIMWRTPEEWGKLIYRWICDRSMTNTVCTFYEISEGDDSSTEEFHGLENWLLVRALKTLQSQGKAELIDGSEGVKFF